MRISFLLFPVNDNDLYTRSPASIHKSLACTILFFSPVFYSFLYFSWAPHFTLVPDALTKRHIECASCVGSIISDNVLGYPLCCHFYLPFRKGGKKGLPLRRSSANISSSGSKCFFFYFDGRRSLFPTFTPWHNSYFAIAFFFSSPPFLRLHCTKARKLDWVDRIWRGKLSEPAYDSLFICNQPTFRLQALLYLLNANLSH